VSTTAVHVGHQMGCGIMASVTTDELAASGTALAAAVEQALPGWVERSVGTLVVAFRGDLPGEVRRASTAAGERAAVDVGARVRALLDQDVDAQRTNPLALLRGAVRYPAEVLRDAGVPPVVRSAWDEEAFPDDDYGLAPATWADIDPSLQEPGLRWSAAKAHTVLARRRAEGRR
jgi:hypothetical protein